MPIPSIVWTPLHDPGEPETFELTNRTAPSPWISVCKSWRSATHLHITAAGIWRQAGGQIGDCGPDGLAGVPFPDTRLAVADCPVGALIGKFGGSSASLGPASALPGSPASPLGEGKAFAIGAFCVVAIPANCIGPLYVGFNGLTFPVEIDSLSISVLAAASGT